MINHMYYRNTTGVRFRGRKKVNQSRSFEHNLSRNCTKKKRKKKRTKIRIKINYKIYECIKKIFTDID